MAFGSLVFSYKSQMPHPVKLIPTLQRFTAEMANGVSEVLQNPTHHDSGLFVELTALDIENGPFINKYIRPRPWESWYMVEQCSIHGKVIGNGTLFYPYQLCFTSL